MLNNYNLLRKVFIILIILSLLYTFFTNSTSSQRLDDLAYVVAIGVDVGEIDTYKISFQVSTVKSSSSESSSSSSRGGSSGSSDSEEGPSYMVNTVECSSIDMGINLLNTYVNKTVNLSHCKIVLISENVAKKGIAPIIYTLVNKVQIRPDCNLIISKIPAEDFIDAVPSTQDVLAKYFDLTSNTTEQETGYSQNITLNQFYSCLKDPICQPYTALGTVSNPKGKTEINNSDAVGIDKTAGNIKSESEDLMVELLGLAVFKDDVLVGELSGMETICHLLLKNELRECTISVPSPFEENNHVDLYISVQQNPKIKVYTDPNSSPFVKVDINIVSRLLSFNSNESNITQDAINQIEVTAEKYLTDQLYRYLNRTSKELHSDVASIGQYATKNFTTQTEWENYDWLANYSSCTFQVNTDITLKSGYLLTTQ